MALLDLQGLETDSEMTAERRSRRSHNNRRCNGGGGSSRLSILC